MTPCFRTTVIQAKWCNESPYGDLACPCTFVIGVVYRPRSQPCPAPVLHMQNLTLQYLMRLPLQPNGQSSRLQITRLAGETFWTLWDCRVKSDGDVPVPVVAFG